MRPLAGKAFFETPKPRWESAYKACFHARGHLWSRFVVDIAHNPLGVFLSLADPAVVSHLYEIAWWHDLSPRRKMARAPQRRAPSKKAR